MCVWHSINASDSTHIEIRLFCLTFNMMMKVSMVIKGGNVRGRDQAVSILSSFPGPLSRNHSWVVFPHSHSFIYHCWTLDTAVRLGSAAAH